MADLEARDTVLPRRPRAVDTIPLGGLLIGIFDLTFAFTYYGLVLGAPPLRIFQSVAAGLLGRPKAIEGGVKTFFLGIVLHFVVATCVASVYFLVSLAVPILIRHPVVSGLLYGIAVYFGMKYIIVPLSAIRQFGTIPRWPVLVTELIGHAVLVGLPIALLVRRSAKANKDEASSARGAEPRLSSV